MIARNQPQLLVCIDICTALTEFVHRDQMGPRDIEKAEGYVKEGKRAAIAKAKQAKKLTETATFGAGCFWGVQRML